MVVKYMSFYFCYLLPGVCAVFVAEDLLTF